MTAPQPRADEVENRIEQYVRRALTEAPQLTEAQRGRLSRLFRSAPGVSPADPATTAPGAA